MKVRMLCNPARQLGIKLLEGQMGEVPNADGEMLVKLGIAEAIAPEIRAVEPEATAEVQRPKQKPLGKSQPSTLEK